LVPSLDGGADWGPLVYGQAGSFKKVLGRVRSGAMPAFRE
jgi:hypothetical protein